MAELKWEQELVVKLYKRQRLLGILLVITLILVIALLLWIYLRGLSLHHRNDDAFSWIETPCEIESVDRRLLFNTNTSTHYHVRYHYTYDGSSYLLSRYSIPRRYELVVSERSSGRSYGASKFEEDQKTVCYVNPASPEEAVLARSSLGISDYARYLVWPVAGFVLYLFVPSFVFRLYRVNQKQFQELITGEKEDILDAMNRLSESLDGETLGFIGRMSVKYFSGFRFWSRF